MLHNANGAYVVKEENRTIQANRISIVPNHSAEGCFNFGITEIVNRIDIRNYTEDIVSYVCMNTYISREYKS